MRVGMDRFFNSQNVERYRKLASEVTSEAERNLLLTLLAEEKAEFVREARSQSNLQTRRGPAIERSETH